MKTVPVGPRKKEKSFMSVYCGIHSFTMSKSLIPGQGRGDIINSYLKGNLESPVQLSTLTCFWRKPGNLEETQTNKGRI